MYNHSLRSQPARFQWARLCTARILALRLLCFFRVLVCLCDIRSVSILCCLLFWYIRLLLFAHFQNRHFFHSLCALVGIRRPRGQCSALEEHRRCCFFVFVARVFLCDANFHFKFVFSLTVSAHKSNAPGPQRFQFKVVRGRHYNCLWIRLVRLLFVHRSTLISRRYHLERISRTLQRFVLTN